VDIREGGRAPDPEEWSNGKPSCEEVELEDNVITSGLPGAGSPVDIDGTITSAGISGIGAERANGNGGGGGNSSNGGGGEAGGTSA